MCIPAGVARSASIWVSWGIPKATRQWQHVVCRALLAITPFLLAGTSWGQVGTFIALGPQNYRRGTGAPVTVTTNFSVLNPNTQYTLKAFNGGLQDDQTELVSSGVVKVNGIQVLGSNNFNQNVAEVDIPVTLQGSNTLSVQVRGRPGGVLTIEIVGVDNDAPTIQAVVSPAPNGAGWNNSNVTVTFVCGDATSLVASCPDPRTVSTEGANQVISGTATDVAGNNASTSIALNIDKTPPAISITSPANGATLTSPSISVTGFVSDTLSGLATLSCGGAPPIVQNGTFTCSVTLSPGANTVSMQAVDLAGNTSSATESVTFSIPPPVIRSFFPHSATAGRLGVTLNLTGSNFSPDSIVEWNGSNRTTSFVSGTLLQAAITASDLASAATATVTVVNPSPSGSSNAVTFTIAMDRIAFDSGRSINSFGGSSNIWIMNPDGSDQAQLTFFGGGCINPAWSPDGSKIAVVVGNNIWVVNADGSGLEPLTRLSSLPSMSANFPRWSPDGSKIAYLSNRAVDGSDTTNTNLTGNVWIMNADGSGTTPLTTFTNGQGTSNFAVSWSPDGSKIAFSSGGDLAPGVSAHFGMNIWVMDADGSGATPLTIDSTPGIPSVTSVFPVWSPDGNRIAYQSTRAVDGSGAGTFFFNIWVMNADGSGSTPLTGNAFSGSERAVWSPDGSRIAFLSSQALDGSNSSNSPNSTPNLWVMNADGSGATPVTALTALLAGTTGDQVAWSPDGSRITFDSRRALDGRDAMNTNSVSNIWVINADGTSAIPLTVQTLPGTDSFEPNRP